MEANQVKLLISLAENIELKQKDRNKIVASLQSAKILTKGENFTIHYKNLKKVLVSDK